MKIYVIEEPSSTFVLDDDWSQGDFEEGLQLAIRCRHDFVMVEDDYVWCPDCMNKHLTVGEASAYLLADALDREGE